MCRAGRKRKSGAREPNGRLARLQKADRDKQLKIGEKDFVLMQPHRRPFNGAAIDQKCEFPLGRFVLRRQLRPELYDAGLEWGSLSRRCLSARARSVDIIERYDGTGAEMTSATGRWLQSEVNRIEKPLRKADPLGFKAIQTLAIYEREIAAEAEFAASKSLYRLACILRKVGRR